MKNLKSAKLDDLNYFEGIANPIYDYIKKTWICKVAPKGYKAFVTDYNEYDGMEDIDNDAITKAFKGYDDVSACSPSFPFKISMPNVAYNDKEQGSNPLRSLIAAILGYGMAIGKAREIHQTTKILSKFQRVVDLYEKYGTDDTDLKKVLRDFKSEIKMAELNNY